MTAARVDAAGPPPRIVSILIIDAHVFKLTCSQKKTKKKKKNEQLYFAVAPSKLTLGAIVKQGECTDDESNIVFVLPFPPESR